MKSLMRVFAQEFAGGTDVGATNYIGILAGEARSVIVENVAVSDSGDNIGGFIGRATRWAKFYNCYWDKDSSGQAESAGGEGRSTAEMTHPYALNTY